MEPQKRILIVDDETELLEMVKTRLEANQYEVITASDGEEGLKKAEAGRPDLIILDIKMPKMNGYTMVKHLRESATTKDVPVIMLTAYDKMQDLFEIEGIQDYVVKPFDDKDLLLRVARAMKKG